MTYEYDARLDGEEGDYQNFLRQIADAKDEGFTPYWLGRNPTFDGITFYGPSMPGFGTDTFGGIDFSYDASLDDGGGSFDVVVVSDATWIERTPRDPIVKTIETEILGEPAAVRFIAGGARPVNVVRMVVQIGDTHVVVTAHSGGSPSPGAPDRNPLIEDAAFLAMIRELRPYPD